MGRMSSRLSLVLATVAATLGAASAVALNTKGPGATRNAKKDELKFDYSNSGKQIAQYKGTPALYKPKCHGRSR